MPRRTLKRTVKLHRAQAAYRHSNALYRVFVGGRGAGKSWVGAWDLIRRAKRKRTYLVGSPTAPLLYDTTFPTFKRLAQEMGVWGESKLTPYPNVYLTTGAEVRFRTAEDPEKMRGPNLSGIWLDEASLMKSDVYTICIASLREAGEQGWLGLTFTPKGTGHWTFTHFGRPRPDVELIQSPTWENPFNPPEFYATLARQYPEDMARQELAGEFLDADESFQVIPGHWVRQAMERWTALPSCPLDAIGVDVARGGADATVLALRHGHWIGPLLKYPGKQTPDGPSVAALVVQRLRQNMLAVAMVDVIGVGASVYDHLRQLPGVHAYPVNFANACEGRDGTGVLRMANVRAFAYWSLRELLDPARPEKERLILPPDQELLADLTAPRWEMTLSGVRIEKKDDIRERLGRSPDAGDAVALATLLPGPAWYTQQSQPERLGV